MPSIRRPRGRQWRCCELHPLLMSGTDLVPSTCAELLSSLCCQLIRTEQHDFHPTPDLSRKPHIGEPDHIKLVSPASPPTISPFTASSTRLGAPTGPIQCPVEVASKHRTTSAISRVEKKATIGKSDFGNDPTRDRRPPKLTAKGETGRLPSLTCRSLIFSVYTTHRDTTDLETKMTTHNGKPAEIFWKPGDPRPHHVGGAARAC